MKGPYELKERTVSLIHLYAGFAMVSDGEKTMRVDLTDVQLVRLAAQAAELAAPILRRWECAAVKSSTENPSSISNPK